MRDWYTACIDMHRHHGSVVVELCETIEVYIWYGGRVIGVHIYRE